jgi:hypothetical protein
MSESFIEMVQKHIDLSKQIRQHDVVFRHQYEGSATKMPFKVTRYPEKLETVYRQLDAGDIKVHEALDEVTSVMESYYDMPYPLDR